MKVVHVLKKIEMIDLDIKELRKLEKSVAKNKSFSTPIYMSIEKQINILLGERIKLLELQIANPPEQMVSAIEGKNETEKKTEKNEVKTESEDKKPVVKKAKTPVRKANKSSKSTKTKSDKPGEDDDLNDDFEMLTQDLIDAKIKSIQSEKKESDRKKNAVKPTVQASTGSNEEIDDKDENVKLLDIALEKGTLSKNELDKGKDKKVRFFRENFPIE